MVIGSQTKFWDSRPQNTEAEQCVRHFFELLRNEKTDEARDSMAHLYADWESQIWTIWLGTFANFHENDDVDDSFEGNIWKTDLKWLRELRVADSLVWDDNHLYVNLMYEGEETDVSGQFVVVKTEKGYCVAREIINVN